MIKFIMGGEIVLDTVGMTVSELVKKGLYLGTCLIRKNGKCPGKTERKPRCDECSIAQKDHSILKIGLEGRIGYKDTHAYRELLSLHTVCTLPRDIPL